MHFSSSLTDIAFSCDFGLFSGLLYLLFDAVLFSGFFSADQGLILMLLLLHLSNAFLQKAKRKLTVAGLSKIKVNKKKLAF